MHGMHDENQRTLWTVGKFMLSWRGGMETQEVESLGWRRDFGEDLEWVEEAVEGTSKPCEGLYKRRLKE